MTDALFAFRRLVSSPFCFWLSGLFAPRDGSRWGPQIFGRSTRWGTPEDWS